MNPGGGLRALREFAARRPAAEACGLCGAALAPDPEHEHLLGAEQRIQCACGPCAALFTADGPGRFKRIPRRVQVLADLELRDDEWGALGVPIRAAFFVRGAGAPWRSVYPSPAGPVSSTLDPEACRVLEPRIGALAADVEALLVIDLEGRRGAFRAPIDVCYRLCGLVRKHFRGLSGGADFFSALDGFIAELRARAQGDGRA